MKGTKDKNNKDLKIFIRYIRPIYLNAEVQKMKKFIQHGHESTFDHVLHVSYLSFRLARRLNLPLDERSIARAAFLHDFYLYDWHVRDSERKRFHGFHHAKTAHRNALKNFRLNPVEEDIIITHMWPLTGILPYYRESFYVNAIDKLVSLKEIIDQVIK